jgi:hypothetical protein
VVVIDWLAEHRGWRLLMTQAEKRWVAALTSARGGRFLVDRLHFRGLC